jgi:hypothetical protein
MSSIGNRGTPADVRAIVSPGERVIAWCHDVLDRPVVLTSQAAYLPGPDGHARLEYVDIANVQWQDPVLEVIPAASGATQRLELTDPRDVPPVLRERVTASILITARVVLASGAGQGSVRVGKAAEGSAGGAGARITARRGGPDGSAIFWQVVFDPGLDPDDPTLRRLADAAIGELRASTGL